MTGVNHTSESTFDLALLLGDGSTISVSGQISEFVDGLANGEKLSLTLQGDFDGNSQTTEASTLDLFFADAGNVDSTTLLDRIRWES